jgi:hypothetical protein
MVYPERLLSSLGAITCMIICIRLWSVLGSTQPLWPIPALYFLEMIAASLVGYWGILRSEQRPGSAITWAAAGVLLAFSGMAGFSVGFYFILTALLLILAALISDIRRKQRIGLHLGAFTLAAVVQVLLMFGVIGLLSLGGSVQW